MKLISLSLGIALFVPLIGVTSYVLTNNVFDQYDKIALITVPNTEHLGQMDASFKNVLRNFWRMTGVKEKSQQDQILKYLNDSIETFEKHQKAYASVEFVPGEEELYLPLEKSWKEFVPEIKRLSKVQVSEIPVEFHQSGISEKIKQFEIAIEKIIHFQTKIATDRHNLTMEIRGKNVMMMITLTVASMVVALLAGGFFAGKLAKNLQSISNKLAEAGMQVSAAAKQIQGASIDLSQATTQQAASLEETAASLEEINSIIKKNSDTAKDSSRMSYTSKEKALKGKEVMGKMVYAINEINESNTFIMKEIDASNKRIEEIIKVISDIGDKTKVINDIVFQTKLLSFNASVEAARAGEQGKGFAVVAEEVGNLAQMSGNASKEIAGMLEESIQKVHTIVHETKTSVQKLVDDGKSKVTAGTEIAKECGLVLGDIVDSVSVTTRMTDEISVASTEQAQGVQEITKAVHQLDEVTQKNTSTTQETATAAQHLSQQAESLKLIVESLVDTVDGKQTNLRKSA